MNTEIIKIVEAGLNKDTDKLRKYAEQLSINVKLTNPTLHKRLNNLLNGVKSDKYCCLDLRCPNRDNSQDVEQFPNCIKPKGPIK